MESTGDSVRDGGSSKDRRVGWLARLREGDAVVVQMGSFEVRIARVAKITPTGIIKVAGRGGDLAFDPRCRRRGIYDVAILLEATPKLVQQVRERNEARSLANRLTQTKFHSLPLTTLRALVAALSEDADA